jgi:hypothetical protein
MSGSAPRTTIGALWIDCCPWFAEVRSGEGLTAILLMIDGSCSSPATTS